MIKTVWTVLILSLFAAFNANAQVVPAWASGADQHDISFGFSFQYINSYFKIDRKPNWRDPYYDAGSGRYITDTLNSIGSKGTPGFALGFIARYSITDNLEVRTTPSLVFSNPSVSYAYNTPSQNVTKQVQRTAVDFPLLMKLKSERLGNFRAYVLGGVKWSQSIASKHNSINDDPINKVLSTTGGFGSYEAGLGFDIYFEYFKLSPEIKISNSLGNVLYREDTPYAAPIDKLSLHTITFSLLFE